MGSIRMDRAVKWCMWRLRNANSMPCVGSSHYPLPQLSLVLSSVVQYLSNIKIQQIFLHGFGFIIIIFPEKGNRAKFQQATENIMQPSETQVTCNKFFCIFKSSVNSNEVLACQLACCNYWKPRCYRSSKVRLWSPVDINRVQYDLISSCKQTFNSDPSLRSP